jgi:heme exporter protein C
MWSLITSLASPKKFYYFSEKLIPWLSCFFFISISYGLVGGLWLAPADYQQGDGFRIIYVHAPAAFLSLFIYAVMASAAGVGIVLRLKLAFLIIRRSALIGASFTLLALVTGSLWGKPMWGTWWIWDARLTSELILLFLYLGILLFQSATAHKSSGERAVAMLVLIGAIDLPIIHYSVYWWNTLHQGATLTLFAPSAIDSSMLYPLIAMIMAFMTYYLLILLYQIRYELIAIQNNPHWLGEKI